jgi:DNA processing protein
MQLLSLMKRNDGAPEVAAISPRHEMGAYEALWLEKGASFKTIAERFAADPKALPSDFVSSKQADECAAEVLQVVKAQGVHRFGVRVNHAGDYPTRLRDARHPVELLYYQGAWELTETRSVAVVGTRKPTNDGIERAERLARELVKREFTVVSGLATGIDTAAHTAAIEANGATISVIGTPLGLLSTRESRVTGPDRTRFFARFAGASAALSKGPGATEPIFLPGTQRHYERADCSDDHC